MCLSLGNFFSADCCKKVLSNKESYEAMIKSQSLWKHFKETQIACEKTETLSPWSTRNLKHHRTPQHSKNSTFSHWLPEGGSHLHLISHSRYLLPCIISPCAKCIGTCYHSNWLQHTMPAQSGCLHFLLVWCAKVGYYGNKTWHMCTSS